MIVVTTPTGNIGQHVVQHLLAAGADIRLIARDPAKLPSNYRSRLEIVEGSHGDQEVVDRAFRGADAVFWLCPPTPQENAAAATADFTRPAAAAIRRHGVRHIVAVTTLGRGTAWQDRAGIATASMQMVNVLRDTGAALRSLALPAFMDNALLQLPTIRQGQMFGVIDPDKKLPHVATQDVGDVAARLLLSRLWKGQEDVPVLGPEELSYRDIAAVISDVLGRKVTYQPVPFDAMKAQLEQRGWPPAFAQAFLDMLRAKNEGMDNMVPRSSAIIGPTTFAQWTQAKLRPAAMNASTRVTPSGIPIKSNTHIWFHGLLNHVRKEPFVQPFRASAFLRTSGSTGKPIPK